MTTREKLFVNYYLGRCKGNATRAALLAGFGSNANSAGVFAFRLLRKVKIREAIDAKLDEIAMTEEEVLLRISQRAASSAEHFIIFHRPESPDALPSLDLTKAKRRGQLGSLKKLKTTRTSGDHPQEVTEVEIHDALPALALLAKFHGLLDPKPSNGGDDPEALREYLGLGQPDQEGEDAQDG